MLTAMAVETPLRGSCDLGSRLKGSPRAHDLPDPVEHRPFEAPTFGCGYKKRSLSKGQINVNQGKAILKMD